MTNTTVTDHNTDIQEHKALASWMGVLFLLMMFLVAVGGFVRLSGSGLSIPDWPVVNGSLLPPFSEAGWDAVYDDFIEDQHRWQRMNQAQTAGLGSRGNMPQNRDEFKIMFIIEWSHRAVAAMLGLVALACCVIALKNPESRKRVKPFVISIVLLIVFQAVLGGILVKTGTSTQWLFLHLGTATIILGLIVWSLLRLLLPDGIVATQEHKPIRKLLIISMGVLFFQIILGALVAGSRHEGFYVDWPTMGGQLIPSMWESHRPLSWNLLSNPELHQFIHRWFAWFVVAVMVFVFIRAKRSNVPERATFSLHLGLGLLLVQVVLGFCNVLMGVPTIVGLAHLLVAMLIIVTQLMALFDLRYVQDAVAEKAEMEANDAISA